MQKWVWNQSIVDGPIPMPLTKDAEGNVLTWRTDYSINVPHQYMEEHGTPEAVACECHPVTPERVFLGTDTCFFTFPDEAAAIAAFPTLGQWVDETNV